MLKDTFTYLCRKYSNNAVLINQFWAEIEKKYSGAKRHYHTLAHLQHLLEQLNNVKTSIKNFDAVLFALYYHDIVYNVLKSNNEQKSAELATARLQELTVPANIVTTCEGYILATQKHLRSADEDCNYFMDADLSTLGAAPQVYMEYVGKIRKEYSIYPDIIYNAGRKKVLQHFLNMPRIYKTDYFYMQLEQQAKENLVMEMALL